MRQSQLWRGMFFWYMCLLQRGLLFSEARYSVSSIGVVMVSHHYHLTPYRGFIYVECSGGVMQKCVR
jgi:hypothetical protein